MRERSGLWWPRSFPTINCSQYIQSNPEFSGFHLRPKQLYQVLENTHRVYITEQLQHVPSLIKRDLIR